MAMSASSSELNTEKLNRTAPRRTVPRASCSRGAQCAPGGVARRQDGLRHRFRHSGRLAERGGRVVQIDELFHQYISNRKQPL